MPSDDEANIAERLRDRLLDAEPSTALNPLAITAAGRRRVRRRAGFTYGFAVTAVVAVVSIGTAISQFTSGSTAQAPSAHSRSITKGTSAARDPSACPSATLPLIKSLAYPDLSVPGAPSVESALKLLLPETTLRTAVRRPLGQPKSSPVWVITANSTYLVQRYRAGEGWYAEPATFHGCQPVSSAASPRPAPTSTTQPPIASAQARHDALVSQLQTNPTIRQNFFLGLDLGTKTVLCGLDILGDQGDTLYAWVDCGAYTTGHTAAEQSGAALPVTIRVEGSGAQTMVIGVDAPRESHVDADLARLFPPAVVAAIKARAFSPQPDARARLTAARADR